MGVEVSMTLRTDSSAARGVAFRSGVGKIKHLEIKTLWFQEFAQGRRDETVLVSAVPTEEHRADLGTKPHTEAKLVKLRRMIGMGPFTEEAKEIKQDLLDKEFEGTMGIGSVTARRILAGIITLGAAKATKADVMEDLAQNLVMHDRARNQLVMD